MGDYQVLRSLRQRSGVPDMIHWRPHVEKPYRGPPYLTPQPAVCGMTMPMNYAEFQQFADHVTCPVCLLMMAAERRSQRSQSDAKVNAPLARH